MLRKYLNFAMHYEEIKISFEHIWREGANRDFDNGLIQRQKRQKNDEDTFFNYYRLFDEILNTPM